MTSVGITISHDLSEGDSVSSRARVGKREGEDGVANVRRLWRAERARGLEGVERQEVGIYSTSAQAGSREVDVGSRLIPERFDETSSTLPRLEEEPQNPSYAAADGGSRTRGFGAGTSRTRKTRVP